MFVFLGVIQWGLLVVINGVDVFHSKFFDEVLNDLGLTVVRSNV